MAKFMMKQPLFSLNPLTPPPGEGLEFSPPFTKREENVKMKLVALRCFTFSDLRSFL